MAAAMAVVAVGGLAAVPLRVAAGTPAAPSLCSPTVTSVTSPDAAKNPQHYGAAGAVVTVAGTNFAQPGCSITNVNVGTVAVPPSAVTVAPGGSSLSFALPQGASGPVSVAATDPLHDTGTSNANFVVIETPTAAVQSASPVEGSAETVNGSGFAPFRPTTAGGISGAQVIGSYTGCGAPSSAPAAASSDSALTLGAPSTYCDGPLTLAFLAPQDTSKPVDCSDPSASAKYNCIPVTVNAGTVNVFFYVASLSPRSTSTVHPGDVIQVSGSGFGATGRAIVGDALASTRWSDRSIAVTVPAGAATGPLTLQRGTGNLEALEVGSYVVPGTVPAQPTLPGLVFPGTPGQPGATGAGGGTAAPGAAGAVTSTHNALLIYVDKAQANPGSTVDFVVTLTIDGRPVSGAPISMSLVSAPNPDATVAPRSGTTDTSGSFRGLLRLSRKSGDHLLLATSGIYSDEVHVDGQSPSAAAGGGLPFGLGALKIHVNGNPVVVWLAVATGILVLLGILVNIEVLRRAVWSFTIGRLLHRHRRSAPSA